MAFFVVPRTRLHLPCITMTAVTIAPKLHDQVSKPGSKLPFKNELTIVDTCTEEVVEDGKIDEVFCKQTVTTSVDDPLESHGQKWEMLDSGISRKIKRD